MSCMSAGLRPSLCWVDSTRDVARTGRPFSYCRVTWLLASGSSPLASPDVRTLASSDRMFCEYCRVAGISSGVSLVA